MNTRTALFLSALATLTLFATGCFERGLTSWEKSRLESRTSDDISGQLDEFDAFAGGLAEVDSARGTWEDCRAGYGGCERCYVLEGTAAAGTVEMQLVAPEGVDSCTQALTLNDVRYEYTIDERQWAGSWDLLSGTPGEDALWSVEWAGNHDATLIVTGSDNADGTYDSSFTMNSATGVTDGDGNLSEWTVDYDYAGFLDRDWNVTAAMDATGAIVGTVLGGDGTTCAISGVQYDVVVDCG
jgi:hypothetical protein